MLLMPVLPPRASRLRYSDPRSPPDQKLDSKRSASELAFASTERLPKITAQEEIEAASSMRSTSCTTGLASPISRSMDSGSELMTAMLPAGRRADAAGESSVNPGRQHAPAPSPARRRHAISPA